MTLELRGPVRIEDRYDLWEAHDPESRTYSCVALCREDWDPAWPALGGTRWLPARSGEADADSQAAARREAIELAQSMTIKNGLLRHAEASCRARGVELGGGGRSSLFGWQGGKGVVWSPWDPDLDLGGNRARWLTPARLIVHGRLVESMAGEYIASKDVGIGTPQLRWMERATRFTIGNGCPVDTGDATARGVLAGLVTTVRCWPEGFPDARPEHPLDGLRILVVGAGKVGLPLLALLVDAGAEPWIYDPALGADASPDDHVAMVEAQGGAIGNVHYETLRRLARRGRIVASEAAALRLPDVAVVSPNGGRTQWLSDEVEGTTRAGILAGTARQHGRLRLVLGAGNDQLPTTPSGRGARDEALRILADAGLLFVPDPVVSPGGVVAVSHEMSAEWRLETVRRDTARVVERSVEELLARARRAAADAPIDSLRVWTAMEALARGAWD